MTPEPFSYSVRADDVPAEGRHFHIEADEAERRGLAEALGILEVAEFIADADLTRVRGRAVRISGTIRAAVVQTDVVTLEPVRQDIAETIDLTLLPAKGSSAGDKRRRTILAAMEPEAPEYYHHGRIDLGVIAAEHLALGLDPYPRAPDSEFAGHIENDSAAGGSPFAALARLKRDDK